MIKQYWWVGLIFIILILSILFFFRQENIYKQAIKQYNEQIANLQMQSQQKDEQIKILNEQISMIQNRVIRYKKQRQLINKPKTNDEVITRLKELGYDAKIH